MFVFSLLLCSSPCECSPETAQPSSSGPVTAAAACRRASQAEMCASAAHLCGLDAPKIQVCSKLRLECIHRRCLLQRALCRGLRWQRQQGRRGALPQRGLRECGHLQWL